MSRSRLAFGPEAPGFGSWDWIGADLCWALQHWGWETTVFHDEVPDVDVAVFVKFKPPLAELQRLRSLRRSLIYCPVDVYASAGEIDADADALRCFDRIIVHCERLRPHFVRYAPVEYLDHHLKFIAPSPVRRTTEGPFVWIGNRSNLPPVTDWLSHHRLPGEVWILTDFASESDPMAPKALGFLSNNTVRIDQWTPPRHVEWTGVARAALDVKGDDFRSRHKPPAKALDFLASGVPLAMNPESSSTEHLLRWYGFEMAALDDLDRWLSNEYWRDVQRLVTPLRLDLSLSVIARRFQRILRDLG